MADEVKSGYAAYATFVKDELDAQDARKSSFEDRGITVITTSGALATLLFGLAALSTKKSPTFSLPDPSGTLLAIALVFFVAAAILALMTNAPRSYEAATAEGLRKRVKMAPMWDENEAERDIALTRIKALEDAKVKNTHKGRLLLGALALEVVAVGFVAVGVWFVITA